MKQGTDTESMGVIYNAYIQSNQQLIKEAWETLLNDDAINIIALNS